MLNRVCDIANGLALAAVVAMSTIQALAQTFPSRPITVLIATAPGDPADVIARLIQPRMAERFGQPWIVDVRPGASGTIATQALARAAPDGHTLAFVLSGHAINPLAIPALPYDTWKDFVGVSLMVRQPLIVAVNPAVKGSDLAEFIAAAKAGPPGALTYGSPGIGSLSFLLAEEISRRAGLAMVHVPFKGGAPAIQALLTNQVQLSALIPAIMMPHIKAGRMHAIAVTSTARLRELPDVPTYQEMGFGAAGVYNWIGAFAPAGTPAAVVSRLNSELNAAIAEPATRTRLVEIGYDIVGSQPAELDLFVSTETARWRKFVAEFNVRFE